MNLQKVHSMFYAKHVNKSELEWLQLCVFFMIFFRVEKIKKKVNFIYRIFCFEIVTSWANKECSNGVHSSLSKRANSPEETSFLYSPLLSSIEVSSYPALCWRNSAAYLIRVPLKDTGQCSETTASDGFSSLDFSQHKPWT